ncbi:hypothetical protein Z043_109146 [Scleropages formosus]|uniref:Uncharacterized protein n=1 Tax=Scleropages formosus TaxID=113540 RepID=A0A0P7URL4_SCLFO|nr:hypothetical protein Z043_109146 [Scleropages formosus]
MAHPVSSSCKGSSSMCRCSKSAGRTLFLGQYRSHPEQTTCLEETAELNVELSRPLKISPTLAKLEQAKAFWRKIFPESSSEPSKPTPSPQPSPTMPAVTRVPPPLDGALSQHASPYAGALEALAPFHRASVRTAQVVVALEVEDHPSRPSLALSLSRLTGDLTLRRGPKLADKLPGETQLLGVRDRGAIWSWHPGTALANRDLVVVVRCS